MILTKEVEIIITKKNLDFYKNLGYNIKLKDIIKVPPEHLSKSSHKKIKVKCDICEYEKEMDYREYMESYKNYNIYTCSTTCSRFKNKLTSKEKYGDENYNNRELFKKTYIDNNSCIKSKENYIKTCLEKYNVDNVSKLNWVKNKRENTMLKKHEVKYYVLSKDFYNKSQITSMLNYGTPHPMMSDEMKKIKIEYYLKMGFNVLTKDYDIYKRKVYRLTRKIKNKLIDLWDGNDYYDNEYIKNNFDLPYHHKNYPTIDHKISIFEGFKNNIPAEKISDISNLCFTKRYINSQKYIKLYFTI